MKKKMSLPDRWHVGQKGIVKYLKPYLDLPDNIKYAWRRVKRWHVRYNLPIEYQPNGVPYLDPDMFIAWWYRYLELQREQRVQQKMRRR